MTAVSKRPFSVFENMTISNATLVLTETGNSFHATINTCGQQISVNLLKDTAQYLILEAVREEMKKNTSISIAAFISCLGKTIERRPNINFMQMNASRYKFRLKKFQLKYKLRPKLELAKIGILVALSNEWNVLSRVSVPTELLNSTLGPRSNRSTGFFLRRDERRGFWKSNHRISAIHRVSLCDRDPYKC